jgi:hypothetical protein
MTFPRSVDIEFTAQDISVSDVGDRAWGRAAKVPIATYWSGKPAPAGRRSEARLLWSASALYVRFEAEQAEPLVVSAQPDLDSKTIGLWDRDVCEIFVAPDRLRREKYYEFEIAPTGEWVDRAIDATSGKRLVDSEFASGMHAAAKIEEGRSVMAMKIPWTAFGKTPGDGEVWLGNIFRCVGQGPDRGYLAWRPTLTEVPNFHVPEVFGRFRFISRQDHRAEETPE